MNMKLFLSLHYTLPWIYLTFLFHQIATSSPTSTTTTETAAFSPEQPQIDTHWGQSLTIDTFQNPHRNDFGQWHGPGEDLPIKFGTGHVDLFPSDPDHVFSTVLSSSCFSLLPHMRRGMFLHVVFAGTDRFSISMNQNNGNCDAKRYPYPETSDSVEAQRYTYTGTQTVNSTVPNNNCTRSYERKQEIYVPLDHFEIDLGLLSSISFHGFYNRTRAATVGGTNSVENQPSRLTLHRVSIVDKNSVPGDFKLPAKLPTGELILRCSRPNSFAFGIDDGQPELAQDIMRILEEENILVTFFAVGSGLTDPQTNFTRFYKEMRNRGHQIALHSWSHPKLEGLTDEELDLEITRNIQSLQGVLDIRTPYFRPPYGTVGARTRQRLSTFIDEPYIVNWSVDIEDWIWVGTDTPEKQLEAFIRGVERGGNLAVLHYLSPSTVEYFRDAIHYVKKKGLQIMRVDQCLQDSRSPRRW